MAAWVGSGIPERAADVGMEIRTQTHLQEIINIHRAHHTQRCLEWPKETRSRNGMNAGGSRIHTSFLDSVKEQLGPGATARTT